MEVGHINGRVDHALSDNRRAEAIIIAMAIGIFTTGITGLFIAYWHQNPYLGAGSILLNSFLYWPIRAILKLRRDNLILQVLPVMFAELPTTEAAKEIIKLADYLRGRP